MRTLMKQRNKAEVREEMERLSQSVHLPVTLRVELKINTLFFVHSNI